MANSGVKGRVIDDLGAGCPDLTILVFDHDALFPDEPLGSRALTDSAGAYSISYPAGKYALDAAPDLLIRVQDRATRILHDSTILNQATAPVVSWPDIVINRAALATGWFATGSTDNLIGAQPGNTVEPLIDNESAWAALTQAIEGAKTSICLMPFAYSIPDIRSGVPVVVTEFKPPLEFDWPTVTLEHVLLEANRKSPSVQVLALLHKNWVVNDAGKVDAYFKVAQPNTVQVRAFETADPLFQMTHAKIVIIDSREVFLLGSPLLQDYFDGKQHKVEDPRRGLGGEPNLPVHDVSVRLSGPAVRDIEKLFLLHWNAASNGGVALTPGGPLQETGDLTVQVVRTLPKGHFLIAPEGEATVLEAYLKAIARAEHFIYLENQYFVHEKICEVLADRLLAKPNLQLIIAMNNRADIPSYSEYVFPVPIWWLYLLPPVLIALGITAVLDFLIDPRQSRRIQQIARRIGKPRFDSDVGVFTLWTHEPKEAGRPKPRMIANYIHSKVAIIDDAWMTIGSANLDDFSLGGDLLFLNGNTEANIVVAHPSTWQPVDAITRLRRSLWSEHLGLSDQEDVRLDFSNSLNFAKLWRGAAKNKLNQLKADPLTPSAARVLEFPIHGTDIPLRVQHAKMYLRELGLDEEHLARIHLQKRIQPFDFKTRSWL